MSTRRAVSTKAAPGAIAPYSQAIIAAGFVHCSGQIAIDPVTQALVGETVEDQTRQVLENLRALLEAAGTDLAQVVKCNVYLKNMDDFGVVNGIYATYFDQEDPPARACVEVSRLPKDVLIEIDCVALA